MKPIKSTMLIWPLLIILFMFSGCTPPSEYEQISQDEIDKNNYVIAKAKKFNPESFDVNRDVVSVVLGAIDGKTFRCKLKDAGIYHAHLYQQKIVLFAVEGIGWLDPLSSEVTIDWIYKEPDVLLNALGCFDRTNGRYYCISTRIDESAQTLEKELVVLCLTDGKVSLFPIADQPRNIVLRENQSVDVILKDGTILHVEPNADGTGFSLK